MADVQTVFQYLHENAGNFKEAVEHFNGLDKAGQQAFLDGVSSQFKLDKPATSDEGLGAKQAFEAGNPRASKILDSGERVDNAPQTASQGIHNLVNAAPMAGMMVGGSLGASATGAATMGVGAPAGGIIGASLGAATGQTIKNIADKMFWPEVAPSGVAEAAASTGKSMIEGATAEMGGQAVGAAITKLSDFVPWFRQASSKAAAEAAPGASKAAEKAAVKGQNLQPRIDEVTALLEDKAVTTLPGTRGKLIDRMKKVENELAGSLPRLYQTATKEAKNKLPVGTWATQVEQNVADLSQYPLAETQKAQVSKIIEDHLSKYKTRPPTFNDIWNEAKAMRARSSDALNEKNMYVLASNAMLKTNAQNVARLASEETAQAITQTSHQWSLMKDAGKWARSAARSEGITAGDVVKTAMGAAVGGKVGTAIKVAAVGSKLAASTLAKTSKAALLKAGAEALGKSDRLGKYAAILAKAAVSGGPEAAGKAHAYMMLNNPKYRELFIATKDNAQ